MNDVPDPPARFLDPSLPEHFVLADRDGHEVGPFDRETLVREPDGAIVFYEDGALPMRLGVTRQDGDVLHLFPSGELRLVTVGRTPR